MNLAIAQATRAVGQVMGLAKCELSILFSPDLLSLGVPFSVAALHLWCRCCFISISVAAGVVALLVLIVVQNLDKLGNIERNKIRCFAIAPTKCMSLNLAVRYEWIVNGCERKGKTEEKEKAMWGCQPVVAFYSFKPLLMGSSKKWAAFISSIASSLYFSFIVFQIPLFRIPCRSGKCTTPIEVTCFQLIISEIFHEFVAKFLLYPGALASAIMKGKSIPSYSKLLRLYNFTNLTNSQKTNLLRLEVLAGSYLSVAGALIGAQRMSLIGTLLLLWGLVREAMMFRKFQEFDKSSSSNAPLGGDSFLNLMKFPGLLALL
ncbi:Tail fiber [Citrus sinensis]|uniref:Tail fiber n=1 Tax=Citrus sinensis TaxID=2711 RepID=A0ACB8JAN5_CITSI|nr:Tail fiber [Citrus sinensis]